MYQGTAAARHGFASSSRARCNDIPKCHNVIDAAVFNSKGDAPNAMRHAPEKMGDAPNAMRRAPDKMKAAPDAMEDAPNRMGAAPNAMEHAPYRMGAAPNTMGAAPDGKEG